MSTYTTQIRYIVESGTKIFDFDYPLFDEDYKPVLEKKFIDMYYFREIGFETVAQFKHFLRTRFQLLIPYYNEHYLAYQKFLSQDAYVNKDLTTTESRKVDQSRDNANKSNSTGTGYVTGEVTNNDREIFSDTPQGKLITDDYATTITERDGNTQSTQNSKDTTSGENIGNEQFTSTDDYIQSIKGFDGMKYASDVYKDVRDVLTNIDQLILFECRDLFLNIY